LLNPEIRCLTLGMPKRARTGLSSLSPRQHYDVLGTYSIPGQTRGERMKYRERVTEQLTLGNVKVADLSVEHIADFPSECFRGERFVKERDPRLEDSVLDDGFVRVPRHVDHLQAGPSLD
jgi:hypothetical protein